MNETRHKRQFSVCSPSPDDAMAKGLALDLGSKGQTESSVVFSSARYFTLTVSFCTRKYKWVPVNHQENMLNCLGVICNGIGVYDRGVAELLISLNKENLDELQHYGPL